MSLATALNSAVSNLKVVQEGIAIASNNISNIDTPGYIRQSADQVPLISGGIGQGVEIAGVFADVDRQLLLSIQRQTADLGYANSLSDAYDSIQRLFGQPDSGNSLDQKVSDFFNSMQILSNNPETNSLRLSAVTDADELAKKIQEIATGLHQMQLDIDKQIHSQIDSVNTLISQLYSNNTEILSFPEGTQGRLGVEQQREVNLRKLSEYLDIQVTENRFGQVSIITGGGISLLDDTGKYQISHTSAASIDNFKNNLQMQAVTVASVKGDGTLSSTTVDLVSSGTVTNVTTGLTSGSIKGLMDLRNTKIPSILEQIDTFASVLTDAVNAIHNDGVSFPPPTVLNGETPVKATDNIGFEGKVMIAITNEDGTPPISPFPDEQYLRPLTLDLSTLDSGDGAGQPTVQTIIDEINDYYGPVQNRAVVGNLRNVRLAAIGDTLADAGSSTFDLEFDNISAFNSTIEIQGITIIDPNDLSEVAGALPATTTYTIDPGDRKRTGVPITLDFSGDDNRASYTVRIQIQVTDNANPANVSVATVDFTVSDDVTGIKNDRYNAVDVTNISGTSAFYVAPSSQSYLTASLVDANGNPTVSGFDGYLKLKTTPSPGQTFGVAIDQLDSREIGLPTTPTSDVTGRGFSHFFGLNNLYVENDVLRGSAINMSLRSDIAANSSLFATGELVRSNQPSDPTQASYTYGLGSGNNKTALRMSELSKQNSFFASAGGLPSLNTTIAGYSSSMIGYIATVSLNLSNNQATEKLALDGLKDLFQESSGVNSDEELARIMEMENNYRASTKIIGIVQELFRALSDTFN